MNPVPVMTLVEVIRGMATSDETAASVEALAKRMGKTPIFCNDSPGFVSNRVLMPMINEAIEALREGVATREAIDGIMKLGMNHPMGPLTLADFIGLDTCLAILRVLHEGFGDPRYRPSPLLVRMVDAGWLGRKSGQAASTSTPPHEATADRSRLRLTDMFCQVCGLKNPDDEELCLRCHSKLLVLSGVGVVDESGEPQEEIPFDEHLLERISTLEDVVKRTAEAVKSLFESMGNLEKNLFVAHTGILALQETLERRGAVRAEEVVDLWESKMDERMQAVEKKDRFLERRDRIIARSSAADRDAFLKQLREAEFAILALDADRGIRAARGAVPLRPRQRGARLLPGGDVLLRRRARARGRRTSRRSSPPTRTTSRRSSTAGIAASESGDTAGGGDGSASRAIERKPDAFLPHFALGHALRAHVALGGRGAGADARDRRGAACRPRTSSSATSCARWASSPARSRTSRRRSGSRPSPRRRSSSSASATSSRTGPSARSSASSRRSRRIPRRLEYQEAVRLLERRRGYELPRVDGPGAAAFRDAEESAREGRC